jgi:hypothetical protein
MDPNHPESEFSESVEDAEDVQRDTSDRIPRYFERTVFDPERTIDGLIQRETAETMPAPPDGDRATKPPGADPIDDPEHQRLVARIEDGISGRLDGIVASIRALESKMCENSAAVRIVEKEATRAADAACRAADAAIEAATVLDQLRERVSKVEAGCVMRHGTSVPPVE